MVCLNTMHNKGKELVCPECRDQTNKAFASPVPKSEVVISICAGIIDVVLIPPGIIVKVHDYDVSDCEEDLKQDSFGHSYIETIHEAPEITYHVGDDDDGDPG